LHACALAQASQAAARPREEDETTMTRIATALFLAALAAGMTADTTLATGSFFSFWKQPSKHHQPSHDKSFQRVGTLGNYLQFGEGDAADETISEIVAATADGKTLVYTDGVRKLIGLIDITNPADPSPLGTVSPDSNLNDAIDYSPTSVAVLGNQYALVANSTGTFADPSGVLVVIDIASRDIVTEIDLGGQPDSIKISPDQRYAAIAIENERDEDVEVDGVEGGLPQAPAGFLAVLRLTGPPVAWAAPSVVDLTGLADYAPSDPEPEFVDINDRNEAVVTLQENNHVVIVDLPTLAVKEHFSAGAVTLNGVDLEDDGVIALTESLTVPREPDAVAWVPGFLGRFNIATANEGDLFGGGRGFSVFRRNGSVLFESGTSFEKLAVRHGHYPDGRSDNKGNEPEGIAYARFERDDYLFVGSERGSFIAVHTLDVFGRPKFEQFLPGPLGPEGLLAIPQRNLFIASGETDLEGFGVRSTVMIYQLKKGAPIYPQILSDDDENGSPIPWSALSGMVAVPWRSNTLLGVWDSAYADSKIFRIDVEEEPAVITDAMTITGNTLNYDPEGIAVAPDHTIWIASEGNASDSRPNLLVQVNRHGQVMREVGLPEDVIACRAASTARGTLGSGFEGVAVLPGDHYRLIVAQQRGWDYNVTPPGVSGNCEDLDDDSGGLNALGQPNWTRLWIYDPKNNVWDHVSWELAPKPANAAWMGLSEITEAPGGDYILIERDNLTGDFAEHKTLVKVHRNAFADRLVGAGEKSVYDLLPKLLSTNGWITDKPEGTAVNSRGQLFVVTDNDGVDDWSGETWFFDLGRYWRLF
jgi:hypothetical protein